MIREWQTGKKPRPTTTAPVEQLLKHCVNEHEAAGVPPLVKEVMRSPGQPLEGKTRTFFRAAPGT